VVIGWIDQRQANGKGPNKRANAASKTIHVDDLLRFFAHFRHILMPGIALCLGWYTNKESELTLTGWTLTD
jgi:hypothetical protein